MTENGWDAELGCSSSEVPDYYPVNRGTAKCSNYAQGEAMIEGVAMPTIGELLGEPSALEQ